MRARLRFVARPQGSYRARRDRREKRDGPGSCPGGGGDEAGEG